MALAVMTRASGRNSSPVTTAELPSTCCRNSELEEDGADDGAGDHCHHGGGRDQRPDPPGLGAPRRSHPRLDPCEGGEQRRAAAKAPMV